jgi:hypothetical protein
VRNRQDLGLDGEVRTQIERALRSLEASRADVARLMADAIVREVPLYQQVIGPALVDDVVVQCDYNLGLFLRRALHGETLADADFTPLRAATDARARQLVPLDALLHATRVAHRTARAWLVERLPADDAGTRAALHVSELSIDHVDAISGELANAYAAFQSQQTAVEDRANRDLVELLLSGSPLRAEHHGPRLHAVGLREGPFVTIVVRPRPAGADGPPADLQGCGDGLVRGLARAGVAALGATRHDEVIAIADVGLRGADAARSVAAEVCGATTRTHAEPVSAGLSLAHATLDDVALAYAEASRAQRHTDAGAARAMSDIRLVDHLAGEADALTTRAVPARLRPFTDARARHRVLVDSLEALWRCDLNAARTAEHLRVHVNTLHYRLRRVAELTGSDPRRLDDLLELLLALRLTAPA